MQFHFTAATKTGSKARVALMGGPGSGKTWTALTLARGLDRGNATIGLIHTERGSAKKYADAFDFRHLGMTTFDPSDLSRATIAAAEQGIDVLIVDTWSPFWAGPEGMLDKVGQASTSFEGWRAMRPIGRQMIDALLGYPGHVIVNLRVKTEYVVEPNERGKMEPKRVGTRPEQRDGIEYEFDVVADMDAAGQTMRISKTRCPELAAKVFTHPTEQVGESIQAWLDRDAIGKLLNPLTVREWALDATRTIEELRDKHAELDAAGQLDAVVYDITGDHLIGVGAFLTGRAREIRKAAQRQAATAERTTMLDTSDAR